MQRPSLALALLFGALASGLVVATVAPCQVIVVFHAVQSVENTAPDHEADAPEGTAPLEYAPADQPAISAPPVVTVDPVRPSDTSLVDATPAADAPRDATPSAVTLTPVAEASASASTVPNEAVAPVETAAVAPIASAPAAATEPLNANAPPMPQWLETGDADPVDTLPPVDSAPVATSASAVDVAAPSISEAVQAAPAESTEVVEQADLLENTAKNVAETGVSGALPPASEPISTPAATIIEERPTSEEATVAAQELATETLPTMSLEGLRDAARSAAVTLDDTAIWVHSAARVLRTWADRETPDQTP